MIRLPSGPHDWKFDQCCDLYNTVLRSILFSTYIQLRAWFCDKKGLLTAYVQWRGSNIEDLKKDEDGDPYLESRMGTSR